MSRARRRPPAGVGASDRCRVARRRSARGGSGRRETPAPHVVAEAADEQLLSPTAAFAGLIAFGAAIIALLAVTGINVYTRYVVFRHSPEVLAARADEVRQRLGYDDDPSIGRMALRPIRNSSPGSASGALVRPAGNACIYCGRRRSCSGTAAARGLSSRRWCRGWHARGRSAEPVSAIDSATPEPGGSYLELAPDGALSAMLVVPSANETSTAAGGTVDWTQTLRRGPARPGGVFARLRPCLSCRYCRHSCRMGRTRAGRIRRAVADRSRGDRWAARYLRILGPWTRPSESAAPRPNVFLGMVFLLLLAVGAVLARRNLQSGSRISAGLFGLPSRSVAVAGRAATGSASHAHGGRSLRRHRRTKLGAVRRGVVLAVVRRPRTVCPAGTGRTR